MAYTTINKPTDHFNTKLWTGTGSSNALTGVGFQPDWVWLKNRGTTSNHHLVDVVRGITKELRSNLTNAEATDDQLITAFGTDGFTLGTSGSGNTNGNTYVGWSWKAGNSAGSSNSDGSITSTVSANTTAGYSIVKWTGDGTKAATVGHGLGVKPSWIIARDYAQTKHWFVYHKELTDNYVMTLNSTEEQKTGNSYWGSGSLMKSASSPTTTTFSFNGSGSSITNINGNSYANIAYCFAEKVGYSKFGKYTGNGNTDGTFVYTGFKPAFVIIKNRTAVESWYTLDNQRPGYNTNNYYILPNTNGAEGTSTSLATSLLSNGFKIDNSDTSMNTSGNIYIYMAFAEAPLVGTNNIPATAK